MFRELVDIVESIVEALDIDEDTLRSRALPAFKHPTTGKVYTGPRGMDHIDLSDRHLKKEDLPHFHEKEHTGYHDPVTKKFYAKKDVSFDSSDLMSAHQRFRKYGTEQLVSFGEFLDESKWSGYVYHAAYKKDLKPYTGIHVGTLHAAMARAYQFKDKENRKNLVVHAFKYKTRGKPAKINDGGLNEPYALMRNLHKRRIVKPKESDYDYDDRTIAKTLQKHLKKKGISHLSYKNAIEDPGSTSHIVFDPQNLKKVHSFKAPRFIRKAPIHDYKERYFDKSRKERKIKENLDESKWGSLVYHATHEPNLKPYPGMHVGNLHAAVARAKHLKTHADEGKPLHIHAFKYSPSGKSEQIIDHTDSEGSPTAMITHDANDVSGFLHRKKVIDKEHDTHEGLAKSLKAKGISHLSYTNTYENKGSTSHMIYDPENLKKVHTFKNPKHLDPH